MQQVFALVTEAARVANIPWKFLLPIFLLGKSHDPFWCQAVLV